ncbi:hypothetical protein EUTSA_v10016119mg [Eutrema salsugineum]|uniref:Uncharacterized protein n=1 Tax=Eutrema salsugineum TaxID=72664 RepID=V4KZY9_EUTSA|nr:hypothetical protein EUTSA_v10016119mg [Eutrema salsugineum]
MVLRPKRYGLYSLSLSSLSSVGIFYRRNLICYELFNFVQDLFRQNSFGVEVFGCFYKKGQITIFHRSLKQH